MARPLTVMVCVVVAAMLIGALIWLWPSAADVRSAASADSIGETTVSIPQQTETQSNVSVPTQAPSNTADVTLQDETDATALPEDPLGNAMESMSQSLSAGDPRTPELAPSYEREKPAPEVLADPQRYAEYEETQSRNIASAYLSMLNQIPTLRARIDAAKQSGSQSPEDIAEAEEALAKLEELKREIEATHPEMLQPVSPPQDDTGDSTPAE